METLGQVKAVDLAIKDLSVSVEAGGSAIPGLFPSKAENRTTLIRDVSLKIQAGELLAIMGGSGSGRVSQSSLKGDILFNGKPLRSSDVRKTIAYVQQNDYLLPYLTVRETLRYAARLRLPSSMPLQKKYEMVEEVILDLGLKEAANTIIGDDWRKGISGGEKRRVS
ncbi:hypothetical protein HK102_000866 [Quaeritorhiza haematococci]|nr:hypothetical protein HK102_000866 [Quaeritorhiza haematococci]